MKDGVGWVGGETRSVADHANRIRLFARRQPYRSVNRNRRVNKPPAIEQQLESRTRCASSRGRSKVGVQKELEGRQAEWIELEKCKRTRSSVTDCSVIQ